MQLFINNWASALTSPATASAEQLSVSPSNAALLTGLGGGDYYLLTLSAVDGTGAEIAWEVVKVTAATSGALTVERGQDGTTAADWPSAASITARLTAGALEALEVQVGLPGRGISTAVIDGVGHLIITYSDGTQVDLGLVVGQFGDAGRGITSATLNGSSHLIITYSDGTTQDAGLVAGGGGGGGTTIIGSDYPDVAPPEIGARFFFDAAVFVGVGSLEPEHWVQISGLPADQFVAVDAINSGSVNVNRMTRLVNVRANGVPGDVLAVVPVMFPAWQAAPYGMKLNIMPEADGLITPVDLDFGSGWNSVEISCAAGSLFTPSRSGNVVSLSVSQGVLLSFKTEVYQSVSGGDLYVEIMAEPASRVIYLEP